MRHVVEATQASQVYFWSVIQAGPRREAKGISNMTNFNSIENMTNDVNESYRLYPWRPATPKDGALPTAIIAEGGDHRTTTAHQDAPLAHVLPAADLLIIGADDTTTRTLLSPRHHSDRCQVPSGRTVAPRVRTLVPRCDAKPHVGRSAAPPPTTAAATAAASDSADAADARARRPSVEECLARSRWLAARREARAARFSWTGR